MAVKWIWMPGAVAVNTDFSLPDNAPNLRDALAGRIDGGHAAGEDGTYSTLRGPTAVVVSKTNERTIQSDAEIKAYDIFELEYVPVGALGQEP